MKKAGLVIGTLILLLVPFFVFFGPALKNFTLNSNDDISAKIVVKEFQESPKKKRKQNTWSSSIFSGTPTGLLGHGSNNNLIYSLNTRSILFLGFDYPLGTFLMLCILTFTSLLVFKIEPLLAIVGSLLVAFNVNYIVLTEAGHQTKIWVVSCFAMLIIGLLLCLKRKLVLGFILVALGTCLAIMFNHIQMVYYLGLTFIVFVITYVISLIKSPDYSFKFLFQGLFVALFAAIIGAGANFAQLYSSKTFSEDTMRGKPILSSEKNEKPSSSSQVEGLDWNYAMSWSNSTPDLLSLFIPRIMGGSSNEEIPSDSETAKLLKQNGAKKKKDGTYQAPMYWGDMPFTSGPYYLGMLSLFLFVLSFFVIEKKYSFSFLAAITTICLISLGKNAEFLNRLLFDNLPLFNKFRSPNSVMNIVPAFFAIPGLMALNTIIQSKEKPTFKKPVVISAIIAAGICLLVWLFGPLFLTFTGEQDARYQAEIIDVFINTRKAIMKADCLRSLFFTIALALVIYAFVIKKITNKNMMLCLLFVITLADLWLVNRRYIDEDSWTRIKKTNSEFVKRPIDQQILSLEPKGRGFYRVLDLSINTFNSNSSSVFHNTIGGYHAAKLQRYQDMIDYHISKFNMPVLNMLNTKYIIGQKQQLQVNNQALGNAWFVKGVRYVETPNEEIRSMSDSSFNPQNTAIILKNEFEDQLKDIKVGDGKGDIKLSYYEPGYLEYTSNSNSNQLAIFSEVWYGPNKGWKISIDGKPTEMIRANYILRGLSIPKGTHKVVFSFEPEAKGGWISTLCSSLILLSIFGSIGWNIKSAISKIKD